MTRPIGIVRALSQSNWSPRLYQQIPPRWQAGVDEPVDSAGECREPRHTIVDREAEVGGLRHPERTLIALVPGSGLGFVCVDSIGDREWPLGPCAVGGDTHRVDVVAGDDPVRWHTRREVGEPLQNRLGDDGGERDATPTRLETEVQIPHRLLHVPSIDGSLRSGFVVGIGELATEPLSSDPPTVAIGADAGERFQVGQRHVAERDEVVVVAGAPIVPHAESRRERCGDAGSLTGVNQSGSR